MSTFHQQNVIKIKMVQSPLLSWNKFILTIVVEPEITFKLSRANS